MKESFGGGSNQKARQEEGIGMHNEGLFDEEGDLYGEKIDPITGKPFKYTNLEAADEKLTTVEGDGKDALPALAEENDLAAQWLKEHGNA